LEAKGPDEASQGEGQEEATWPTGPPVLSMRRATD